MTPLTQQLEDKKKGCGRFYKWVDEEHEYFLSCSDECLDNYCPQCKAEIKILEQAIAEMQKQRQEILDEIRQRKKVYENEKSEVDGTWDTWFELRQVELFIEKLNQPKTEDVK